MMLCDKLKDYSIVDIEAIDDELYKKEKAPGKWVPESRVYLKKEVDSALDELKREHHRERHEYIDMVAQLKAKLEDVQATAYTESVDACMENRKLKRAMWLARGYIMTLLNRDFQRLAYQCNNDDYKRNLLRRRNRYYELSEKCLKKAEEYK